MLASASAPSPAGLTPVAVVWCRQVDNEAESPGYTTIPEEFPGRRETLEAIRTIGNLTVNVADTHDYWDPDPSQPLSYYPNLFLYPAANGRYTCVGRMFLSTEDRPRLGMKTLVFSTADLVATGEFGPAILRAHASMGGKSAPARVAAEPETAVYQAIGEGFLFHRGTTDPVVVVAADQWEASCQVVLELVRVLPTSLVALGAFLVFPYFLPEAKVNPHEFTEQVPLALAVMRVPKAEAQGDRHSKRLESWDAAPVVLRDLTKPTPARSRETLPLVLQYVRDHQDAKIAEVAHRVDAVEGERMRSEIHDAERQGGRDRRKEMWRIGTAMETAALLLGRPKGRSVPMTGEAVKRANEYLQAQPSTPLPARSEPVAAVEAAAVPAALTGASQHPPWLQRPTEIDLPVADSLAVPLSVSDDNSLRAGTRPAPNPPAAGATVVPVAVAAPVSDAELEARIRRIVEQRLAELPRTGSDPADAAQREARLLAAVDTRVRDASDQANLKIAGVQTDFTSRIAAIEARPIVDPGTVASEVARNVHGQIDPVLAGLPDRTRETVQATTEAWATRLKEDLQRAVDDLKTGVAHSEDELRLALAAQLEVELAETKEQGTALREEIESRVRELLRERLQEVDQQRARDVRELEQKLGLLVDGRTKDVESRLRTAAVDQRALDTTELQARLAAALDARSKDSESRLRGLLADQRGKDAAEIEAGLLVAFDARAKESETRLRTALSEQRTKDTSELDTRLALAVDTRTKDGEARVRSAIAEQRAKDARELEQRLGLLIDARAKDVETRLKSAFAEQQARSMTALESQVVGAEKRLSVEREARISEVSESQTQALAGLQVRLQAYVEQKLHENQDREREKYVELLARLRSEVEQALARSIDPARLEATIRDQITPALDSVREGQAILSAKVVQEAETRLRAAADDNLLRLEAIESRLGQREADLQRVEAGLRTDVDDLDRRIQVLSDRMIPLLRRTWIKVGDLEKGPPLTEEAEARLKEFRREMVREVRRIEGELIEQTNELRDRLEGTIAHQGRIWLNLLKQLSAETEELSGDLLTGPRPAARPSRLSHAPSNDDFLTSDLGTPVAYAPIDADPPNPIAPPEDPATDAARDGARRRARRN